MFGTAPHRVIPLGPSDAFRQRLQKAFGCSQRRSQRPPKASDETLYKASDSRLTRRGSNERSETAKTPQKA
eukprot:5370003-Pyramimonas_sp.AAC.1